MKKIKNIAKIMNILNKNLINMDRKKSQSSFLYVISIQSYA